MPPYETDHDRLIRIDENVNMIKGLLEKYEEEKVELVKRIGKIELFQAKLIGIAATVSFIVTVIITQISRFLGLVKIG